MKGDLDAGYLGILGDEALDAAAVDGVGDAVGPEQHDAVAGAAILVGEVPDAFGIESDDRLDPAGAVEIGPLIAEAQMAFDDAAANGLEIDHPGIALEISAEPVAAIGLKGGTRLGVNGPVVESAALERDAGRVAPPHGIAVNDRDVGADMLAREQFHPHMAGRLTALPLCERTNDATPRTHPAHVVNRFGKHREVGRQHTVGRAAYALALGDQQLVVNPSMLREEIIGFGIVGRNDHVLGTGDALEVLIAPRVVFDDGHGRALPSAATARREPRIPSWCGSRLPR